MRNILENRSDLSSRIFWTLFGLAAFAAVLVGCGEKGAAVADRPKSGIDAMIDADKVFYASSFTSLDKSEFVIERDRMYTSNPCNPMQDGRVTPENVRPRAKNPIIAGFFREIGRADRLGSGVRNLYKYSKDYGGADPVFTEGNNFVISVSLKKLDPIRFPFGKQPIGGEKPHIGDEKQPIGTEKPHIGDGKQPIEPKKQPIEEVLLGLQLTRPTYANIMKLYNEFSDVEVFGRALVMKVCGLADGPAGMVIRTMLRHRLLDTVKGHGKGKYRFRSEFSVTNP